MADLRLCSIPDCGNSHYGKGFCSKHYKRLWKYGSPYALRSPRDEARRFYEEFVLPYEGKECLIWPYAKNRKGYGLLGLDRNRSSIVSRLVCEDANGPPPTPEHEAAHSCGKGHEGCVTKGHLSWKTRAENEADKHLHGTYKRGEQIAVSVLTENDVTEIRSMIGGGMSQYSIAKRYGITQQTVSDIKRGKSWSWL